MEIITAIILVPLAIAILCFFYQSRPRRPFEHGYKYIYVNEDGSAKEITPDEIQYLSTNFNPNDGNRPYVKFRYESKTPAGSMSGYLLRRRLPKSIVIQKK